MNERIAASILDITLPSIYLDFGLLKEAIYYSGDSRVLVRIEHAYTDQNRLSVVTTYNPDNKIIKKATSEYDREDKDLRERLCTKRSARFSIIRKEYRLVLRTTTILPLRKMTIEPKSP